MSEGNGLYYTIRHRTDVNLGTRILFAIYNFEIGHGRGPTFNELIEVTGLERDIVSKSIDSM